MECQCICNTQSTCCSRKRNRTENAEIGSQKRAKGNQQAFPTVSRDEGGLYDSDGYDTDNTLNRSPVKLFGHLLPQKSSGITQTSPKHFVYFEKEKWNDFSDDTVMQLTESLKSGKVMAEIAVWGCIYVVNFLFMMQINMKNGYSRSIAWMDESGRWFLPSSPFEGKWNSFTSKLPFSWAISDPQLSFGLSKNMECSISEDESDLSSDESCQTRLEDELLLNATPEATDSPEQLSHTAGITEFVSGKGCFPLLDDKLINIRYGCKEYASIGDKFLCGLGSFAKYAEIKAVYKNAYSSVSGKARQQMFLKQVDITKRARGDANVHYAWHATSKQGVSGVILHGFGQPSRSKTGSAYGMGVYLAPESYSSASAFYSDIDENGEQHVVLCKVILGNTEVVSPGSSQFHPSSEHYDTGVDDMLDPKRYIVWMTHMNTHILPVYVITFKLSAHLDEIISARGAQTTMPVLADQLIQHKCGTYTSVHDLEKSNCHNKQLPSSPWVSLSKLLSTLMQKLPKRDMVLLKQRFVEFKAGKVAREIFVKEIRKIAGDDRLYEVMKTMQAQVPVRVLSDKLCHATSTSDNKSVPVKMS